jgi:hypothetical protein
MELLKALNLIELAALVKIKVRMHSLQIFIILLTGLMAEISALKIPSKPYIRSSTVMQSTSTAPSPSKKLPRVYKSMPYTIPGPEGGTKDVNINYEVSGPEDGTPIMLVHGFGGEERGGGGGREVCERSEARWALDCVIAFYAY